MSVSITDFGKLTTGLVQLVTLKTIRSRCSC